MTTESTATPVAPIFQPERKLAEAKQCFATILSNYVKFSASENEKHEKDPSYYSIDADAKAAEEYQTNFYPLFLEMVQFYFGDQSNIDNIESGIQFILDHCHFHLVSEEIYQSQLNELDYASQFLVCFSEEKRKTLSELIQSKKISLQYEYMALYDRRTKIQSKRYHELEEIDPDNFEENKQSNISAILDMHKKNIDNIQTMCVSREDFRESLNDTLASAYEYYADDLYEVYDFQETVDKKIRLLNEIIKIYSNSYMLVPSNLVYSSILHFHFIRAELYEQSDINDCLAEIDFMISEVDKKKTDYQADLRSRDPECADEMGCYLACCEKGYLLSQDNQKKQEYQRKASNILGIIEKNLSKVVDKQLRRDLSNWLYTYGTNLKLEKYAALPKPAANFSMAPATEPHYKLKRRNQILDGLKKPKILPLRKDQEEAVEAFQKRVEEGDRTGYFNFPTGWGKTILFIELILRIRMPTGIFAPGQKLLDQAIEKIKKYSNDELDIVYLDEKKQRVKTDRVGDVCVGTYQMLSRRLSEKADPHVREKLINQLKQYGIFFYDEVHRSLSERRASVISILDNAYHWGLTATPVFTGQRKKNDYSKVSDLYGRVTYRMDTEEAINRGLLCAVINIVVQVDTSKYKEKIKRMNREQTAGNNIPTISPAVAAISQDQKEELENNEMLEAEKQGEHNKEKIKSIILDPDNILVIAHIYRYQVDPYSGRSLFGMSGLVLCRGKEHARLISAALNELGSASYKNGVSACIIADTSQSERNRIYKAHENMEIPVMVGVSVFNEGYDNPDDELLINASQKKSLLWLKQGGGRVLRNSPGKNYAIIIDINYGLDQVYFRKFLNDKYIVGKIPQYFNTTSSSSSSSQMPQIQNVTNESPPYTIFWNGDLPQSQNNQGEKIKDFNEESSGAKRKLTGSASGQPSKRPHTGFTFIPYDPRRQYQNTNNTQLSYEQFAASRIPQYNYFVPSVFNPPPTSVSYLPSSSLNEPMQTETSVRVYPKQSSQKYSQVQPQPMQQANVPTPPIYPWHDANYYANNSNSTHRTQMTPQNNGNYAGPSFWQPAQNTSQAFLQQNTYSNSMNANEMQSLAVCQNFLQRVIPENFCQKR